jgi:O-antigen ligase
MNKLNPTSSSFTNNQIQIEKSDLITKTTLTMMLFFIFLMPFGDGIWDGLPRVAATLVIGFSLILFLTHGTHRNYSFFHFFSILYITWQIISLMWTPDIVRGTTIAITSIQLILLAFLFTLIIDTEKKILWAYQAYVFGNIVGSGIIFSNYIQGIQSPYWNRYGIKNIETDELSVFLALSIPMAAYLATKHKSLLFKGINVIAIPIIYYSIFLTGTRTGSVIGLLGIAYWLFTHRKASIAIKTSMFILLIASVVAIFSFAPKASVDRIFSTGKSLTSGTLNYRSVIWKGSISQWKESPIIGPGLGSLGVSLSKENIDFTDAHNAFVHILSENGIIGLLFYLSLLVSILYYISQNPLEEKAFLICLFLVLIISQQTTHTQVQKIIWFVLSMMAIHSHYFSINKRSKP